MPVLLSTAYFPPVSYFAAMAAEMGGLQSYKGCLLYTSDAADD